MDFSKHTARIVDRLGDTCMYTHAGDDPIEVAGVFAAPPTVTLEMEAFLPSVTCKSSDVPLIEEGDTFVINGDTYRVASKDYDRVAATVRAELEIVS